MLVIVPMIMRMIVIMVMIVVMAMAVPMIVMMVMIVVMAVMMHMRQCILVTPHRLQELIGRDLLLRRLGLLQNMIDHLVLEDRRP